MPQTRRTGTKFFTSGGVIFGNLMGKGPSCQLEIQWRKTENQSMRMRRILIDWFVDRPSRALLNRPGAAESGGVGRFDPPEFANHSHLG